MTESKKKCFVICPFGPEGSPARGRSDYLIELIRQAVEPRGYDCDRTIDDQRPGQITSQIIADIRQSELVVADLTGLNPNVMYELAIRHATGKPYIHLIDNIQTVPFDIAQMNFIVIGQDFREGQGAVKLIEAVREQFDNIEKGNVNFSNPAMEPVSDFSVQYFVWVVSFEDNLHEKFLALLDEETRNFIALRDKREFRIGDLDTRQQKRLAEYLEMEEKAGRAIKGHMFYQYERKSESIDDGWVLFDLEKPPLALEVLGNHSKDRITLKYTQPPWPKPVHGKEIPVGPYNYSITFTKQGAWYSGDLIYPKPFPGGRLKVATTRLLQSPGIRSSND